MKIISFARMFIESRLGNKRQRLAWETMNMVVARYHERFKRELSQYDLSMLVQECNTFLEHVNHLRLPSADEVEKLLDNIVQ